MAPRMAIDPSSGAVKFARLPLRDPIGVLFAATITVVYPMPFTYEKQYLISTIIYKSVTNNPDKL